MRLCLGVSAGLPAIARKAYCYGNLRDAWGVSSVRGVGLSVRNSFSLAVLVAMLVAACGTEPAGSDLPESTTTTPPAVVSTPATSEPLPVTDTTTQVDRQQSPLSGNTFELVHTTISKSGA